LRVASLRGDDQRRTYPDGCKLGYLAGLFVLNRTDPVNAGCLAILPRGAKFKPRMPWFVPTVPNRFRILGTLQTLIQCAVPIVPTVPIAFCKVAFGIARQRAFHPFKITVELFIHGANAAR
jgi:hypothetical protein